VDTIVLSECFTTSSTLRPLLSAGLPVAGSAGIDASELIEPETSITQQMSKGARQLPLSLKLSGSPGGVNETRTSFVWGSEDRHRVVASSLYAGGASESFGEEKRLDMIRMTVVSCGWWNVQTHGFYIQHDSKNAVPSVAQAKQRTCHYAPLRRYRCFLRNCDVCITCYVQTRPPGPSGVYMGRGRLAGLRRETACNSYECALNKILYIYKRHILLYKVYALITW
jgi:hypothetical protein